PYLLHHHLHSFPTRRSSDLSDLQPPENPICRGASRPAGFRDLFELRGPSPPAFLHPHFLHGRILPPGLHDVRLRVHLPLPGRCAPPALAALLLLLPAGHPAPRPR